jgi:hypothetical protein
MLSALCFPPSPQRYKDLIIFFLKLVSCFMLLPFRFKLKRQEFHGINTIGIIP